MASYESVTRSYIWNRGKEFYPVGSTHKELVVALGGSSYIGFSIVEKGNITMTIEDEIVFPLVVENAGITAVQSFSGERIDVPTIPNQKVLDLLHMLTASKPLPGSGITSMVHLDLVPLTEPRRVDIDDETTLMPLGLVAVTDAFNTLPKIEFDPPVPILRHAD